MIIKYPKQEAVLDKNVFCTHIAHCFDYFLSLVQAQDGQPNSTVTVAGVCGHTKQSSLTQLMYNKYAFGLQWSRPKWWEQPRFAEYMNKCISVSTYPFDPGRHLVSLRRPEVNI